VAGTHPSFYIARYDAPGSALDDPFARPAAPTLRVTGGHPAGRTLRLSYELPHAGPVALGLYDITGRRWARLVDGWQPAGRHAVTVARPALPAGVYFARLRAGGVECSRKWVTLD